MTASGEPGRELSDARVWWQSFEPIHAVVYFADECRAALVGTGLRGFWMGYFAGRAVPLGAVGPATVSALFFSFDETMVRRALPDAWRFAEPDAVERARRESAATVLRRVCRSVEGVSEPAVPVIEQLVERADGSGRALFCANRDLPRPDDPVEALWQGCTCLREHRGDGHVAALTAAGLDGCEALVLFALSEAVDGGLFRASRGWSDEEWSDAVERLAARGLVGNGEITSKGRELRDSIEETTDRLAAAAFEELHPTEEPVLRRALTEVGNAVVAAGVLPFPNPIGLPAPDGGGSP